VSEHNQRRSSWFFAAHYRFLRATAAFLIIGWLAGCSSVSQQQVSMPPTSIENVEYYPFQVKGYENTFPARSVEVVPATDDRDFKDAGGVSHESQDGRPAIGVILDQSGKIDQRLYGPPLADLVQNAIASAAHEAGMVSLKTGLRLDLALSGRGADYIMAAQVKRFWVNKHRGPDDQAGATWSAAADVTLSVAIYKPPFNVPFWQGDSAATYNDPPLSSNGGSPEDDTEIYDQPGQVLSVALTRAVAGIFMRNDLHTLLVEDSQPQH
jgi:hypothetical protein